jgi:hypothetical protein
VAARAEGDENGDGQPTSTAAAAAAAFDSMSTAQRAFYLVTIVLPALMSIVSSLRQDLNYGPKIVALRYAAAEVLSEAYRFRSRTGRYGDRSLAWGESAGDGEDGGGGGGGGGGGDGGDCTVHDTISARAAKLTQKLVEVSARIDSFNRPDAPPSPRARRTGPAPAAGWWCGGAGGRAIRVYAEGGGGAAVGGVSGAAGRGAGGGGDADSGEVAALGEELGLGGTAAALLRGRVAECEQERLRGGAGLSGDEYLRARLVPGKARCEREADRMERCFLLYRVAAYVLGALGSILSLLRFEARGRPPFRPCALSRRRFRPEGAGASDPREVGGRALFCRLASASHPGAP